MKCLLNKSYYIWIHPLPITMKYFILAGAFLILSFTLRGQNSARIIYFPVDSFHLSNENVELIEKALASMGAGDKVTFRVLIHDDPKNKAAINELDRKRSLELHDFFIAEGYPAANIKMIKTPGREAKGFISDEMKNLLVYDVEVYKALPAVSFTMSDDEPVLRSTSVELFKFNSSQANSLTTSKGIQVNIPSDCFEYKTGAGFTGNLALELKSYLNPGEIAAAGLMTMNDEFPLHCGAILWLRVSGNDKELRIKKGKEITLKIPAPKNFPEALLYQGQSGNDLLCMVPATPPVVVKSDEKGMITITIPCLHWIGLASAPKNPDNGNLVVKSSSSYHIAVRLIIEGSNMVMGAYDLPGSKDIGFTHVPTGKKAVLVAYGKNGDKLFFYSKEIFPSNDGKEKIQLKESTEESIKAFLIGLDPK